MRQIIKHFLWIAGLMFGLQTAWAFSLLGPLGNGGDASWQIAVDGFNPLTSPPGNPYGFDDPLLVGPKNIGEEYRRNTPVMYYVCDDNFTGFFGSNGTNAVYNAFTVLNNLANVSSYSSALTEFPLQSEGINYQADALGLVDLKSLSLVLLMEQLGVADSIRYTWVLHSRWTPAGTTCPVGEEYAVTVRNFDILNSPLDQLQYSPYVNNALYTYEIYENCGAAGSPTPINGSSIPLPVDPLSYNPPVASGIGMGYLQSGGFYTGLTRDDVAGLRYLLQAANVNTESPAAGSLVQTNSVGAQQLLTTLNLNALFSASVTSSPAALAALFPGLVVSSSTSYYVNVNGTLVQNFANTFANVITNSYSPTTAVTLQTTTIGPPIGSPYGSPAITNTTTTTSVINVPSGDFYLLPAGDCGFTINQSGTGSTTTTTTLVSTTTNATSTNIVNQIVSFTSHQFVVTPELCPFVTPPAGQYEGVENIKFVGISSGQYDTLTGQFYTPITNNYTMSLFTPSSGVVTIQNFQRVLTAPDIRFTATDLTTLGGVQNLFSRTTPAFNQANILPGLAGPGTIDPGATITFNKSGPVFYNEQTTELNGTNSNTGFIYASFDGSTNVPVLYPNGTSIATLQTEVLIQISPSALPAGTVGSAYNAAFSATGGTAPYSWSLAPGSPALPGGLTLSSGGVISGTPSQNGVYDFIIQLADNASHIVQENYSITIN
jgi:hypothetical protein